MRLSPVSTKRHSTLYFSLRWNWYATIGPTRQTVGPILFVKRLPWTVMIVPGLTLGTCPHERNRIALLRARMIHARPRTSSEPQPRSPSPSTTPARCPKKFPPPPIITRLGSSTIYTPWRWTRTSRRKRPAAAGCRHPRPEDASPGIRRSETGRGASCRPNEAASATRYAWRPWSRFSARSSRVGTSAVPAAGFGEGQRGMILDLHCPQPAQALPLRCPDRKPGIAHCVRGMILPQINLLQPIIPNPQTDC